jgi:hypothetical protein
MKSTRLHRHKPNNVASEWLRDCKTEQAKKERIEYIRNSTPLFDQLKEMIQRRFDGIQSINDTDYDSPSWLAKQAHKNGQLAALEDVFKLLP